MAANYTANYNLCQWEATDQVQRTDFNQDNAKIDAELAEHQLYARLARSTAYNLYRLMLERYYEGKTFSMKNAVLDGLENGGFIISTTGGVQNQGNVLSLSGTGSTGTAVTPSFSVGSGWKRAIAWVHYKGGTVGISLNDTPMVYSDIDTVNDPSGGSCIEMEFQLNGDGSSGVAVTLTLDCEQSSSVQVYNYGLIFL